MKIAVMQPYFFPYIGYWQLIHAVDKFILFDDAQYTRHGWINRNRILKPGGGWQYIVVPLRKHAMTEAIKNVCVHPEKNWKELIVRQLEHYRKLAQYFDETRKIITEILLGSNERSLASINAYIIRRLCGYLGIEAEIIVSSERKFDYSNVRDAGEWALRISEQMGAGDYINPMGGAPLFDKAKFLSSNIKLSFLRSHEITYPQRDVFESSLSIIDVLMFNGLNGTKMLLKRYSVQMSDG